LYKFYDLQLLSLLEWTKNHQTRGKTLEKSLSWDLHFLYAIILFGGKESNTERAH